jgi:transcriptional regulator with XRE-family HTH domain
MAKNNIAILRKKLRLNQQELGERLGVVQATVSGWESGNSKPSIFMLEKMAGIFNVTIGFLMGYEEEAGIFDLKNLNNPQAFQTFLENKENKENAIDPDELAEQLAIERETKLYQEFAIEQLKGEWLNSRLPIYFESFYINQAFEHMIKGERERLLEIAKLAFPNAFEKVFEED